MKIKLDENLGQLGVDLLASAGHEVSTVLLQKISGISDMALYEACVEVLRFPPRLA